MSYDVSFRVKVQDKPIYTNLAYVNSANITWNVRELILKSSGWDIKNCDNNGLATEWIKKINKGIEELTNNPNEYRQYEASNGWGTVEGTLGFYKICRGMFEELMVYHEDLIDVAVVWVS